MGLFNARSNGYFMQQIPPPAEVRFLTLPYGDGGYKSGDCGVKFASGDG
jgi:hypothetical protein